MKIKGLIRQLQAGHFIIDDDGNLLSWHASLTEAHDQYNRYLPDGTSDYRPSITLVDEDDFIEDAFIADEIPNKTLSVSLSDPQSGEILATGYVALNNV